MKKFLALILSALLPIAAFAQPYTATEEANRLIGLSMNPEWANEIANYGGGGGSGGTLYENNVWIKWRNAADTANINVLKVDATDDTTLNADSGDIIKFTIAETQELQLFDDELVFPGTSGTLTAAGDLNLKTANDSNRLLTFTSTNDTTLRALFGDGTTASQVFTLRGKTSDAADTDSLNLSGGGGIGTGRGAYITLEGADVGGADNGRLLLNSTASMVFATGSTAVDRLNIASTGQISALNNVFFTTTGFTLGVDSGTAASACKGTLTANGATPVVTNTTCAATSSIPFLQKTDASTAVNGSCTVTAISNGTSFTVECLATDTGTYSWWILKEG
jgi:hypothetical protein